MFCTRTLFAALFSLAFVWGCSSDSGNGADGGTDGGTGNSTQIADQEFGAFEEWATPIADYIELGDGTQYASVYNKSITDLIVFDGRMWLGYGDATYNLGGFTPIEFRYFQSSDDPAQLSAIVNGDGEGEVQQTPEQTGEEQIDRYRICDGELLQPGIDSIDADELWTQANTDPPAVEGNVYSLNDVTWDKYRSIPGGEHVHDLMFWNGALYSVGSGADNRIEFEAGEIFRYLWKSEDGGEVFETVQRVGHPDPGNGDTRFVHLLPVTNMLYVFGYESDWTQETTHINNSVYSGGDAIADIPDGNHLADVFPWGTAALPDGTGLVYGIDIGVSPARHTISHVAGDGSAERLASFNGYRILDIDYHVETDELVYLACEGDEYGGDPPEVYNLHVLVADAATPGETVDVLQHSVVDSPGALAYWDGALFLGTNNGHVLKAGQTN